MEDHDPQRGLTRRQRVRLFIAAVCAIAAVLLALLPHDWIERAFAFEPDGGSGAFELWPVIALAIIAVMLAGGVVRRRLARSWSGRRAHGRSPS